MPALLSMIEASLLTVDRARRRAQRVGSPGKRSKGILLFTVEALAISEALSDNF